MYALADCSERREKGRALIMYNRFADGLQLKLGRLFQSGTTKPFLTPQ
jgi:hypothetical protein